MNKAKIIFYLSIIIFILSLGLSIFLYIVQNNSIRRVFFFEHIDQPQLYIEDRYIAHVEGQSDVELFVKELVLGPLSDRYRPIFPRGTSLLSCFVNQNEVNINLSENAAFATGTVSISVDAVELLNKNICTNFSNISKVNLFISGKKVYEEDGQNQLFQIKSR